MPTIPPTPPQPPAPPATKNAAQSGSSGRDAQAALNRLVQKYKAALQSGNASTIASLAKQIATAAKALNQHVTLPTAPSNNAGNDSETGASTVSSAEPQTAPAASNVNVKA